MARVLCYYSVCLHTLNALRTEGLGQLLNELVKATSKEIETSLSPPTKSESKKSATEIAQVLAGEKESCEAANANESKVRFLAPSVDTKYLEGPLCNVVFKYSEGPLCNVMFKSMLTHFCEPPFSTVYNVLLFVRSILGLSLLLNTQQRSTARL